MFRLSRCTGALLTLALASISSVVAAEDGVEDLAEPTVRLCEVPNAAIRDMVHFELVARGERVARCDVDAPITLRIVFADRLRDGFVEVRSGLRTLQTRIRGPLDTLDDRAVAVTAAALVEAIRAPAEAVAPPEQAAEEMAPVTLPEHTAPSPDETAASDAEEGDDEPSEEEALDEENVTPFISYLEARHVVTLDVGAQNIGAQAAFAAAIGYGAMPSANIRVGTQLAFAFGRSYSLRLDLRGTYVWHHRKWTTEFGGEIVGSLRVFHLGDGLDAGTGGGLHGGANWYTSDHFGIHFGVEANALYLIAVDGLRRGAALEVSAWAGVRFGP